MQEFWLHLRGLLLAVFVVLLSTPLLFVLASILGKLAN
jgi:hypothetical protein